MLTWGWFTSSWRVPSCTPPLATAARRTLLVIGGKVPCDAGGIIYVAPSESLALPPLALAVRAAPMLDAVDLPEDSAVEALLGGRDASWRAPRELFGLVAQRKASEEEASAAISAVSLLAWHRSAAFSGTDGSPTALAEEGRRSKLASGRTLYPRVDPVAIVLVESADGSRCLLGRQSRYPAGFYTCISGFVEHAESAEAAAAREVHEETGVVCGSVALVASQPWPCGRGNHCELMLACAARADSTPEAEAIRVANGDGSPGELEDARWFSREEARQMLRSSAAPPGGGEGGLSTPPPLAIAHHMIRRWAEEDPRWPSLT